MMVINTEAVNYSLMKALQAGKQAWVNQASSREINLFEKIASVYQQYSDNNLIVDTERFWRRFIRLKHYLKPIFHKRTFKFLNSIYSDPNKWLNQDEYVQATAHKVEANVNSSSNNSTDKLLENTHEMIVPQHPESLHFLTIGKNCHRIYRNSQPYFPFIAIVLEDDSKYKDAKSLNQCCFKGALVPLEVKLRGLRCFPIISSMHRRVLNDANQYWLMRFSTQYNAVHLVRTLFVRKPTVEDVTVLKYYNQGDLIDCLKNSLRNPNFNINYIYIFQAFYPLICQIASLHKDSIAHRDIKPDNICSKFSQKILFKLALVDFETTSIVDVKQFPRLTQKFPEIFKHIYERPHGTFSYFSPEMLLSFLQNPSKTNADTWIPSDMWALGLVLSYYFGVFMPEEFIEWRIKYKGILDSKDIPGEPEKIVQACKLCTDSEQRKGLDSLAASNNHLVQLIGRCFEVNPIMRITSAELRSEWEKLGKECSLGDKHCGLDEKLQGGKGWAYMLGQQWT